MTSKEAIKLLQADEDGKTIQKYSVEYQKWFDLDKGELFNNYILKGACIDSFRIKPEYKIIPLAKDDIDLHRDLFRRRGIPDRISTVYQKDANFVWLSGFIGYTYNDLVNLFERSTDGGKTWFNCGKSV